VTNKIVENVEQSNSISTQALFQFVYI